jgi:hypothetical protein
VNFSSGVIAQFDEDDVLAPKAGNIVSDTGKFQL